MLSVHETNLEFLKQFLGENLSDLTVIVDTHKGDTIEVPIVYAKRSAMDYSESVRESYPKISIYNHTPEIRKDLIRPNQPYRAFEDSDNDGKFDKVHSYTYPVPFTFQYDVSAAAKTESHIDAIRNWFISRFSFEGQSHFVFNKISVPLNYSIGGNTDVGEPVYYDLESQDIYRSDGVHETMYVFKVLVWIDNKAPITEDLLTTLALRITHEHEEYGRRNIVQPLIPPTN